MSLILVALLLLAVPLIVLRDTVLGWHLGRPPRRRLDPTWVTPVPSGGVPQLLAQALGTPRSQGQAVLPSGRTSTVHVFHDPRGRPTGWRAAVTFAARCPRTQVDPAVAEGRRPDPERRRTGSATFDARFDVVAPAPLPDWLREALVTERGAVIRATRGRGSTLVVDAGAVASWVDEAPDPDEVLRRLHDLDELATSLERAAGVTRGPAVAPPRATLGPLRATLGPVRCAYCHDALDAGRPVRACDACGTPLHPACAAELGGCAVLGCAAGAPGQGARVTRAAA